MDERKSMNYIHLRMSQLKSLEINDNCRNQVKNISTGGYICQSQKCCQTIRKSMKLIKNQRKSMQSAEL